MHHRQSNRKDCVFSLASHAMRMHDELSHCAHEQSFALSARNANSVGIAAVQIRASSEQQQVARVRAADNTIPIVRGSCSR
eukprot:scaffold187565_cov21-Prasinocladus_malaysianus.AAC.2